MSTRKRGANRGGFSQGSKPAKGAKKAEAKVIGVVWNKNDCAPQLNLSKDGMSVSGEKGYRMVRANAGVREGHYYFECEILPPPAGSDGNIRIGWAAITGELQAPVGCVISHHCRFRLLTC